jgi:hypothetical protein
VLTYYNFREMKTVFVACCHGEEEEASLSDLDLVMLGHGSTIVSAIAFQPKGIKSGNELRGD